MRTRQVIRAHAITFLFKCKCYQHHNYSWNHAFCPSILNLFFSNHKLPLLFPVFFGKGRSYKYSHWSVIAWLRYSYRVGYVLCQPFWIYMYSPSMWRLSYYFRGDLLKSPRCSECPPKDDIATSSMGVY